jgi:hypothetical protein
MATKIRNVRNACKLSEFAPDEAEKPTVSGEVKACEQLPAS